jgi:hypothetical protein
MADRFGTLICNTAITDRSSRKFKKSFREGELQAHLGKNVRHSAYIQLSRDSAKISGMTFNARLIGKGVKN